MDENRRKRRRRRRIIVSVGFLAFSLTLAWIFESQATTTVVFVRYAELQPDDVSGNPGLSPSGRVRAAALSRVIGDIDVVAGIDAIFATQFRSTQETAEPVADRLQ